MVYGSFQSLSPAGLLIDDVAIEPDRIVIAARCRAAFSECPDCGRQSGHVHSRYERRLLDLPSHGRVVQLQITVRRFRCATSGCRRRIFAEPLGEAVAGRSARRTFRLEAIVHHLGVALGGRPAATLAKRLMLPVSKDTLRRVVDLLPDREPATVEAWLLRHPEIRVISRDRGSGYGQAATRAAPQAIQVADRWHLMENASAAFLEAVRRSMRTIRVALGSTVIDPALLTHAERLQHDGYLRRQEAYGAIRALATAGTPIREIVRRTGRSRKLVREIVRGGGGDVFRCRSNILEPHLARLDAEWSSGCRNGAELWRRLPRQPPRCRGVGDTAPASRECRPRNAAKGAARAGAQPTDAERARSADERGRDHRREHRERRADIGASPRLGRALPSDDTPTRSGCSACLDS